MFEAFFERGPFFGGDEEWDEVEGPWAFDPLLVAVDIISDAVVAEDSPGAFEAVMEGFGGEALELLDEELPMGPGLARREGHFVEPACWRAVSF